MTYGAFTPRDFAPPDLPPIRESRRRRTPAPQATFCAITLSLGTAIGLWMFYAEPVAAPPTPAVAVAGRPPSSARTTTIAPPRSTPALFDPAFAAGRTPLTFDQTVLLTARFEPSSPIEKDTDSPIAAAVEPPVVPPLPIVSELVRDVPLPMPRPSFPTPADPSRPMPIGSRPEPVSSPATPPDRPSFFENLFGSRPRQGMALAYAAPDDFGLGRNPVARALGTYGQRAAVYDIAAHTVYLPTGARLEAHSGLGSRLDDPRSVAEHMRGATPPAVYELSLREQLFHGVRALRLNPIGGGTVYGRAGLLAHTYMLGPRGDSNGCVVFRDYRSFLAAFESGEVNRLVVVSNLN